MLRFLVMILKKLTIFLFLYVITVHANKPSIEIEVKAENRGNDEGAKRVEYKDTNNYSNKPLCGDVAISISWRFCFCGNVILSAWEDLIRGDLYCCVPPSKESQCESTENYAVICQNGQVKKKTETCNNRCWNSYQDSKYLYNTASLNCLEEDFCLGLDLMCSGVCKNEAELCDSTLRCIGDGFTEEEKWRKDINEYSLMSLKTEVVKEHYTCLQINNDGAYDSITREDEVKIYGTHQRAINYNDLIKCWGTWGYGIMCQDGCLTVDSWCSGAGTVCPLANGNIVSADNPEICQNQTFWDDIEIPCDYYLNFGNELWNVGKRCSGSKKQCIYPWYTKKNGIAAGGFSSTCLDNSDKVYPFNTSCKDYNTLFLEKYKETWCLGKSRGYICDGGWILGDYYES